MRGIDTITAISISTTSTAPLRGIVAIDTGNSTTEFELSEEMAHSICTNLEHFLTQRQQRRSSKG